jgi:hypothetical protein
MEIILGNEVVLDRNLGRFDRVKLNKIEYRDCLVRVLDSIYIE